uniref:La protein n=1 Tax=Timema genevievae TaxID=629358 RepID=A0A7R9K261_TIMGE|nr:unnamed protein product [Timema genevievae]
MAETNGVELKVEASEEDKLKAESLKVEKETKVEDDIKNDNTTCDLGNKIKSELSGEETSDLEKKIIRQIEYYFGDINLPRDKFLLEQVKLQDGWIPLDVMFKFKRLSSLTTDAALVCAALEKSPNKLLEVSEDRKQIRRSPAQVVPVFNEERRKELTSRTVYCKGFPVTGVVLDDLLPYFATYGPIETVMMRSYLDKAAKEHKFKGSVYVIFKTKELAEKFLNLESVKYGETELIRKWQSDYLEFKKQERDSKRKNPNAPQKKFSDEKAARQEAAMAKGAILHLEGFSGETSREDVKRELVSVGAEVAYIEYCKGDSKGLARLQGENSAQRFLDRIKDTPFKVCGQEIEMKVVEGEEEEEFLKKTKETLEKKREHPNYKNKRGRGGKFRGGRGGGRNFGDRKRKGNPSEDEPPTKIGAESAD